MNWLKRNTGVKSQTEMHLIQVLVKETAVVALGRIFDSQRRTTV